jgi:predicted nucleic acid-binding protein
MLIDTNIVIYCSKQDGGWLSVWMNRADSCIASVTRIEALGYSSITEEEAFAIRGFLGRMMCCDLDEEIIEKSIVLRQQKKMGLGDAIIAATALEYGVPLVTRNEDDFEHISGLRIINPFAQG